MNENLFSISFGHGKHFYSLKKNIEVENDINYRVF